MATIFWRLLKLSEGLILSWCDSDETPGILRDPCTIDIRRATRNWEQHRQVDLERELQHSMGPIARCSPSIGNWLIGVVVADGVVFDDTWAFAGAIRTRFLDQGSIRCSQD